MAVLAASIGVGMVLGWAAAPRPAASPFVWLMSLVALGLLIGSAAYLSAALLKPALIAGGIAWTIRSRWMSGLHHRKRRAL